MRITVYCGSSAGNREIYGKSAFELGAWMGRAGHELVYGGSETGLMGAVADGVLSEGGMAIGVIPDIPQIQSRRHPGLTRYIETDTVAMRKNRMIELAEAFIALPGGLGTLDEITEILSLSSLDIVSVPVIFYNMAGYYEPLKSVFSHVIRNGFGKEEYFSCVTFAETLEDIARALEN